MLTAIKEHNTHSIFVYPANLTMPSLFSAKAPELVSVIIPCYNHGKYLSKAIDSVLSQSYPCIEIVVVDDGSADDTGPVAASYAQVKYVYQHNQGPSAARNTGIDNSAGAYLVFLDADDWLFEDAVYTNLKYLIKNSAAGFVSGAYTLADKGVNNEVTRVVNKDHYLHLLLGNYISMHATVMYPRRVLDLFRFDTTLRGCEDYDVYLRIARKFPVLHHTKQIAVYTIHNSNSSENIPLMLRGALKALNKQKEYLVTIEEKEYFHKGVAYWISYYSLILYTNLLNLSVHYAGDKRKEAIEMLKTYNKHLYYKYLILKPFMLVKKSVIKNGANFFLRWLYHAGAYNNFVPWPGKVIKGDFNRTTPFSKAFGYNRGGPIDRYYIENFLQDNVTAIKGRVLEIGDNAYTMRYGGERITKSDVLHIEEGNKHATYFGDLSNVPQIPDNCFDCIILTQTLQFIYDYKEAMKTCFRILKPGGSLLLTAPGISHIDHGEWKEMWFWSFTKSSITRLLSDIFSVENIEVKTLGNVLTASSFLYGMGLPEISKEQLDYLDPHYQVIITAAAVKPTV